MESELEIKPEAGVTLLELLVAMAILAVLLAVAAPSMREQYSSWVVKSRAQQLLGAVMAARGHAMTHRATVTLCPWPEGLSGVDGSDLTPSTGCVGNYSNGFAVVSEEGKLLRYVQQKEQLHILNRAGTAPVTSAVSWNPRGIGNRNLTFSVCREGSAANWSLVLNRVGRPRLVQDWGVCPVG